MQGDLRGRFEAKLKLATDIADIASIVYKGGAAVQEGRNVCD